MANQLLAKAKRWLQKPENQARVKRAARTAYRKYKQKNSGGARRGPSD